MELLVGTRINIDTSNFTDYSAYDSFKLDDNSPGLACLTKDPEDGTYCVKYIDTDGVVCRALIPDNVQKYISAGVIIMHFNGFTVINTGTVLHTINLNIKPVDSTTVMIKPPGQPCRGIALYHDELHAGVINGTILRLIDIATGQTTSIRNTLLEGCRGVTLSDQSYIIRHTRLFECGYNGDLCQLYMEYCDNHKWEAATIGDGCEFLRPTGDHTEAHPTFVVVNSTTIDTILHSENTHFTGSRQKRLIIGFDVMATAIQIRIYTF